MSLIEKALAIALQVIPILVAVLGISLTVRADRKAVDGRITDLRSRA